MGSTYLHPPTIGEMAAHVFTRQRGSFQHLPNLPKAMKFIAEEQGATRWTNFAEGGVTRPIRDMQTMYMGDLDATHTVDHWVRDNVCKLMGLSHET